MQGDWPGEPYSRKRVPYGALFCAWNMAEPVGQEEPSWVNEEFSASIACSLVNDNHHAGRLAGGATSSVFS